MYFITIKKKREKVTDFLEFKKLQRNNLYFHWTFLEMKQKMTEIFFPRQREHGPVTFLPAVGKLPQILFLPRIDWIPCGHITCCLGTWGLSESLKLCLLPIPKGTKSILIYWFSEHFSCDPGLANHDLYLWLYLPKADIANQSQIFLTENRCRFRILLNTFL